MLIWKIKEPYLSEIPEMVKAEFFNLKAGVIWGKENIPTEFFSKGIQQKKLNDKIITRERMKKTRYSTLIRRK